MSQSAVQDEQLSRQSLDYLARRPRDERHKIGQFLTPRILRERLIEHLPLQEGDRVLDPGVGTGEFLLSCQERTPNLSLFGWDIDQQVLDVARELVPHAELSLQSALEQPPSESFDVVIGNPPYFEVRGLEPDLRRRYQRVLSGRPNIFSMFFQAGLDQLRLGGHLGFVVPPSMNNGAFFKSLRTSILEQASIEFLEVYKDNRLFQDAQTAVQLIVLKKGGSSTRFTIDLGTLAQSPKHRVQFTDAEEVVAGQFPGRTTLWHLGFEAVTGTLVWNQHKDDLRRAEESGSTTLLWAHNITSAASIVLNPAHPKKPQFVMNARPLSGPAIIVNRIVGSVGSGNLRCAIVPSNVEFVGENHVNVIRARQGVAQALDWPQLLEVLRQPGINDRVRLLTGNTQLSATELTHWLPLDAPYTEAPVGATLF